jgi:hypothetical protein
VRRRLILLGLGLLIAPLAVRLWVAAAATTEPWMAAVLAFIVVSAIALSVFQRPRTAIAGGLLIGVGVTFAYGFASQAQGCVPARGCTLGDNTLQISILVGFVIAGVLMSIYALTRPAAA